MTYPISDCFMISLVCGFIFGIVYELFRLIRRILNKKIVDFVCDVMFFAAAAFFVLQLSLYLGNYVRIYTLLGFGCGMFAYINTLGRLISAAISMVLTLFDHTIGRAFRSVTGLISKLIGAFAHKTMQQFGKIHDFLAVKRKKASSLLQFHPHSMYNSKRERITIGESSRGKNVIKAKITRGS